MAQLFTNVLIMKLISYLDMKVLISYLEEFAKCYEGDAYGLASDFELVAGISMNEMCNKLSDEIENIKSFSEED